MQQVSYQLLPKITNVTKKTHFPMFAEILNETDFLLININGSRVESKGGGGGALGVLIQG